MVRSVLMTKSFSTVFSSSRMFPCQSMRRRWPWYRRLTLCDRFAVDSGGQQNAWPVRGCLHGARAVRGHEYLPHSNDSRDPCEKLPSRTSCLRLRLVAQMRRTLVLNSWLPPTRLKVPSCSTRNNFTCASIDISPISSRKIVPVSAASNLPFFCCTAPVNEPRSWLNNSDS